MKIAICLAAISVLAISGCANPDPTEVDEDSTEEVGDSGEEVGEAADALCPVILMPTLDQSVTLPSGYPTGGSVGLTRIPNDFPDQYAADNFTVDVTFPGYGAQSAFAYDVDQASLTSSNCHLVTVTSSFWTHDASTGCWASAGTTSATGSWNGTSCDVDPDGLTVPHTIDKVRVSTKSKMGTTFRTVGAGGRNIGLPVQP